LNTATYRCAGGPYGKHVKASEVVFLSIAIFLYPNCICLAFAFTYECYVWYWYSNSIRP